MMEGAAQLLTDGFAGFPLLRASPSPVPGLASAWRPQGAAAGAGAAVGLAPLPAIYYALLAAVVAAYMALAALAKRLYVRRFGCLL